jgi:hypothetical protein
VSFVRVIWAVNWIAHIIANFKNAWENDFINRAGKYFESTDYERLEGHCQDKLAKYPNHSHATWWLARVKLETGKSSEVKNFLKSFWN